MYMLSANNGQDSGAFALEEEDGTKLIYFFEEEEDAERYLGLLEADDYPDMIIVEVDKEVAIKACKLYNYSYAIITPKDLVFPPPR